MSIPLNIDWQQILLHLFNFAILAGGLYLLLYKPVKQFMEQREADYRKAYDAAQAAQAQAEQLKADQTARLAQADADLAQKRAQAEQELEELRARQMASAKKEAEAILAKARESARHEREEMISRATKELMEAAASAAEKIALGADGDPYDQFLRLAERRSAHEQSR